MKTNRIIVNFRFLVLIITLGICQIGCAKKPLIELYVKDSEPDTVLHNNSKYIAVIGDIQSYFTSPNNIPYYEGSLEWIASHNNNISFVLHTGDVTDHNWISEWQTFETKTVPFTETMPFYTCIGNHDYRCNAPNQWNHRDSTHFSQYVGFPSTISHIVAYYDSTSYENILVREELFANDPIYLLFLELEPRTNVLQWADSVVKSYPNDNIILIVHSYIYYVTSFRYQNLQYMVDSESHPAQYVWEHLVYPNDNIRCVLCGHTDALSRQLYSTNSVGRIVPQIMFNIQYEPHGGNGLIELWEFNRDNNVYVRTYNTHLQEFVNDSLTNFQFKFK